MRMVIVGGGKVGWNLARIMLERRHNVSLIEKDRQRCERLADDLDAAIYRGDGTNVGLYFIIFPQNMQGGEKACFWGIILSYWGKLEAPENREGFT